MSRPRRVLPETDYALSRRCASRAHMLPPLEAVNQNFSYCLGVAAERFEVDVHAWLMMSNHLHTVVHDRHGNLPEFMAFFYGLLARAMNGFWDRWESFWAAEQASAVRLVRPEDTLAKIIYAMMNPVEAGIVEHVADWPGASSLAQNLGLAGPECIARPAFFRPDGPLPPFVTLEAKKPHRFDFLSEAEWSAKLALHIRMGEEAVRDKRRASGIALVGVEQALAADPSRLPSSVAPRRQLRPTVACADTELRKAELTSLRAFRAAHTRARREEQEGVVDVQFPDGTYLRRPRRPETPDR